MLTIQVPIGTYAIIEEPTNFSQIRFRQNVISRVFHVKIMTNFKPESVLVVVKVKNVEDWDIIQTKLWVVEVCISLLEMRNHFVVRFFLKKPVFKLKKYIFRHSIHG